MPCRMVGQWDSLWQWVYHNKIRPYLAPIVGLVDPLYSHDSSITFPFFFSIFLHTIWYSDYQHIELWWIEHGETTNMSFFTYMEIAFTLVSEINSHVFFKGIFSNGKYAIWEMRGACIYIIYNIQHTHIYIYSIYIYIYASHIYIYLWHIYKWFLK